MKEVHYRFNTSKNPYLKKWLVINIKLIVQRGCSILFNIQEKYNLEQMEFIKRRTKVFIIDISFMDRC